MDGLRAFSLVLSLVQFASAPFRTEPALPESQATELANAFTHGAAFVLRSLSQEYRARVLAHIKEQQVQQQQKPNQHPPTPPLSAPAQSSPPPPPPPPPSKHASVPVSSLPVAIPQTPLEDSTMVLISDLSKAGAPSSVITALLPFPSHSSVSLLSPSAISATGTLTPVAPAIPPLCHTTAGEISLQSLLNYILSVCAVVIHHAKDASGNHLSNRFYGMDTDVSL